MEENNKIKFVYFTTYTKVPEFEGEVIENESGKWVSSSWENTKYSFVSK